MKSNKTFVRVFYDKVLAINSSVNAIEHKPRNLDLVRKPSDEEPLTQCLVYSST
jgi:hypothetical protein